MTLTLNRDELVWVAEGLAQAISQMERPRRSKLSGTALDAVRAVDERCLERMRSTYAKVHALIDEIDARPVVSVRVGDES